jgi:hypothetical protein
VRSIGREERRADRKADTPRLRKEHGTAPAFLLGKTIRLLPNADGELRVAEGDQPSDPAVERYLAKDFSDYLAEVRSAMEMVAARHDPVELRPSAAVHRVGCGGEPCRPCTTHDCVALVPCLPRLEGNQKGAGCGK